jgi:hypothetical protein
MGAGQRDAIGDRLAARPVDIVSTERRAVVMDAVVIDAVAIDQERFAII